MFTEIINRKATLARRSEFGFVVSLMSVGTRHNTEHRIHQLSNRYKKCKSTNAKTLSWGALHRFQKASFSGGMEVGWVAWWLSGEAVAGVKMATVVDAVFLSQ